MRMLPSARFVVSGWRSAPSRITHGAQQVTAAKD
jgi:hypothetical protein